MKLPLTVGPWLLEDTIYEADHRTVAAVRGRDDAAEVAAFIVAACNNYQSLLDTLQSHQAVGDHVEICPCCGIGANCTTYNGLAQKAIDLTKSALEEAE